MVGKWTVNKPSRSDEVLDSDEQLRIANQIRAEFDSMAPKRSTKPNRSESDSSTSDPFQFTVDHTIPELSKLRSLQSQSHEIFSEKIDLSVEDDFVETQYYKELDSIEKQHHTTGSGFIKVVTEGGGDEYGIQLQNGHGGAIGKIFSGFRSNPATNDWVPKSNDDPHQVVVSSKPDRSESS